MASPLETTAPGILGNSDAQCQPERAAVVSMHRCGLHAPWCQANTPMQMKFSDILIAYNWLSPMEKIKHHVSCEHDFPPQHLLAHFINISRWY